VNTLLELVFETKKLTTVARSHVVVDPLGTFVRATLTGTDPNSTDPASYTTAIGLILLAMGGNVNAISSVSACEERQD